MRIRMTEAMPCLFDVVMRGFSVSASSANKELLRASERHLFLFVRLCEWAEGDKALASYGIKNTGTIRSKEFNYQDVLPELNVLPSVREGIKMALHSYDMVLHDLYAVLTADVVDYTKFTKITKACLGSLTHITELCRIAEYSFRSGEGNDMDTVEAVADSAVADVDWDSENRITARVYYDGMDKATAREFAEKMMIHVLWEAYIDVFINGLPMYTDAVAFSPCGSEGDSLKRTDAQEIGSDNFKSASADPP